MPSSAAAALKTQFMSKKKAEIKAKPPNRPIDPYRPTDGKVVRQRIFVKAPRCCCCFWWHTKNCFFFLKYGKKKSMQWKAGHSALQWSAHKRAVCCASACKRAIVTVSVRAGALRCKFPLRFAVIFFIFIYLFFFFLVGVSCCCNMQLLSSKVEHYRCLLPASVFPILVPAAAS